jgi:hypothetical protein
MVLPGYELLAHVQASVGSKRVLLGEAGHCRYCGTSDAAKFRKLAHTLPEALGNKWILSRDECDDCNSVFGAYDDALAKSVGGILTVGGTLGKGNRVRQTGRSSGPASIAHGRVDGRRQISMRVVGAPFEQHVSLNAKRRDIVFITPTGSERFVPRYAYQALVKVGLALMPSDELANFTKLAAWLLEPDGNQPDIGPLIVGLSFGSVGNSPQLAAGALMRRTDSSQLLPYMISVVSVGSVCFQIELMEDVQTVSWPVRDRARPNIRWTNVLGPRGRPQIKIDYGEPVHLDWSSSDLEPSPIEAIETQVNISTQEGRMVPLLRSRPPNGLPGGLQG